MKLYLANVPPISMRVVETLIEDGSIEVTSENGCTNFCLNFPLKMSA